MLEVMLDHVTTPTNGEPVDTTFRQLTRDEIMIQVDISGTAAVSIKGRISGDMPWLELFSATTSGLYPVARLPWLRADATGVSTGDVTVMCHG